MGMLRDVLFATDMVLNAIEKLSCRLRRGAERREELGANGCQPLRLEIAGGREIACARFGEPIRVSRQRPDSLG
jgi:hypothetical protein